MNNNSNRRVKSTLKQDTYSVWRLWGESTWRPRSGADGAKNHNTQMYHPILISVKPILTQVIQINPLEWVIILLSLQFIIHVVVFFQVTNRKWLLLPWCRARSSGRGGGPKFSADAYHSCESLSRFDPDCCGLSPRSHQNPGWTLFAGWGRLRC